MKIDNGPIIQQLWDQGESVFEKILDHPFNKELMQGDLDKEKFRFYIQQDSLYLFDFGKALSIVGSKMTEPADLAEFARFAEGAVVVEKALHEGYFEEYGIDQPMGERSPSCSHYTSFLLNTCSVASAPVGAAALLPCFWIYKEVGDHIYEKAKENNPFQSWIETYAGEEFAELVQKMLYITEKLGEQASSKQLEQMKRVYLRAAQLEWMFWDSAYRLEKWPVS